MILVEIFIVIVVHVDRNDIFCVVIQLQGKLVSYKWHISDQTTDGNSAVL